MAKDDLTDAPPSSRSSFQRFEKVLKALMAVPKKDVDAKAAEVRHKRAPRKKASNQRA